MIRGAIAIVLLVALARPVAADDDTSLAQARRDVESSDYMAARQALVAALDADTAGPDELGEIYKLSGIVEAALGDAAASQTAFAKWLEIDPKAALPTGTSPKITRPFDAAKARKLAPIKVKTETSAEPPRVTLVITADPLAMVTRARVFVSVDGKPDKKLEAGGKDKIAVALPHGKRLDVRVQALDAHGNVVVELGSSDVPIVITGAEENTAPPPPDKDTIALIKSKPETPPGPPPSPRPIALRWYVWGGAAVAFGIATGYFGLQARSATNELNDLNANSSAHKFSEAQAVESRARRDVLLTNIGLGVTGAFAVGAAILYLTAPHATESRVAAVPISGGGAVVVGGHF